MKCLSCGKSVTGTQGRLFHELLVCSECHALAVGMEKQIEALLARARHEIYGWLKTHILAGGLLRPAKLPDLDPRSVQGSIGLPSKKE